MHSDYSVVRPGIITVSSGRCGRFPSRSAEARPSGILGRNGSGKSTLLQIICGTLTPTLGSVETFGRVAALLELGAGFNPEFTGRENVYLNGSVLGLTNEQIDTRFDAIARFADIGDFIDQPVKTYSSGMYVRLAFAVSVNVDADVLIVDEALSVGDIYFQSKCIAHLHRLIDSGVSVLFVSHDLGAVKSLCQRALFLDTGRIAAIGTSDAVADAYYNAAVAKVPEETQPVPSSLAPPQPNIDEDDLADLEAFAKRAAFQRVQNGQGSFLNVRLLDESGGRLGTVRFGQTVILRMISQWDSNLPFAAVGYHIRDRNGYDIIYSDTGIESRHIESPRAGQLVRTDWKFRVRLREGAYTISAVLSIPLDLRVAQVEVCDFVPLAENFTVYRAQELPLHGAVYWDNSVSHRIISEPGRWAR